MLNLIAPYYYINEPGITKKAGAYIKEIGTNPLIISGKTAMQSIGQDFFDSLKRDEIATEHLHTFDEYPSERNFKKYAELAANIRADSIIAIGGGRVIDTAKGAADEAGLPVTAIPTIAATCAAWAAISIQYDDNGAFVKVKDNQKSPALVLADPSILLQAPIRYLFSGVVDTYAKYYETRPALAHFSDNATVNIMVCASKLAFDFLEKSVFTAVSEAKIGVYDKAAKDVIDAIIYLAGFVGSLKELQVHYSFAHPFYHSSTRLPHTRILLHGEKVSYGIIAQLFMEKRPKEEIIETIKRFDRYEAAFTLNDLGINENRESDLAFLAKDILETFPYVPYAKEEIINSMIEADALTHEIRESRKEKSCR